MAGQAEADGAGPHANSMASLCALARWACGRAPMRSGHSPMVVASSPAAMASGARRLAVHKASICKAAAGCVAGLARSGGRRGEE